MTSIVKQRGEHMERVVRASDQRTGICHRGVGYRLRAAARRVLCSVGLHVPQDVDEAKQGYDVTLHRCRHCGAAWVEQMGDGYGR